MKFPHCRNVLDYTSYRPVKQLTMHYTQISSFLFMYNNTYKHLLWKLFLDQSCKVWKMDISWEMRTYNKTVWVSNITLSRYIGNSYTWKLALPLVHHIYTNPPSITVEKKGTQRNYLHYGLQTKEVSINWIRDKFSSIRLCYSAFD
jgi:hypothetical protein